MLIIITLILFCIFLVGAIEATKDEEFFARNINAIGMIISFIALGINFII